MRNRIRFLLAGALLLAACVAIPEQKPTNLRIRTDLPTLNAISWDGFSGAEVFELWVRKRTGDDAPWSDWKYLGLFYEDNYEHHEVRPGMTYQYRLRAWDVYHMPIGYWSEDVQRAVPTRTPSK